ncbi:hypothetical protein [Synechococcus sp. SynAce01]|uniref:hypothetical protein n=1 Tax=Synechococcus sp. SynAce01 TaxID=1916956 RepID=UPI0013C44510|nr:hypothetical protein [Synechococcus sp. SynAce01]
MTGERSELAALLGEVPAVAAPAPRPASPGPWRVTASMSGQKVQISNNHESRVIRKLELETYLRRNTALELV